MKKLSPIIVLATTLALTACGGNDSPATPTTSTPTTTTPTTTKPSVPENPASTGIVGTKMSIGRNNAANPASPTNITTNINTVVINGEQVEFMPRGFMVNQLNMQNSTFNGVLMWRVGGSSNLSYTRYGYFKDGSTGEPHLFAQGELSTNTPSTGTATYKGNGAELNNGKISLVDATFNVDYGQKTLTGTVGTTALSATINGNAFAGTKDGISTTGYFYGTRASELGGTYRNANGTLAGAYAAKK